MTETPQDTERADKATEPLPFKRRLLTLAVFILIQATSAVFFLDDVVVDYRSIGMDPHTRYEAAAVGALCLGVIFGTWEMVRIISRWIKAETALDLTRKAFKEMIEERFTNWALTRSESDVALLTLKGFEIEEIATLRNTAQGTVRAQLAKVYAKSGLHTRGQFVSSFIDDLLESPVHQTSFGKT